MLRNEFGKTARAAAAACLGSLALAPAASAGRLDFELRNASRPSAGASEAAGISEVSPSAGAIGGRVIDPAAYAEAKARAGAAASAGVSASAVTGSGSPTVVRNWEGIRGLAVTPTDSTNAIGTTRFIELVNRRYAIYDRSGKTPLDTGTLFDLAGCLYCDRSADPQVMWDATTRRFYVVFLEIARYGSGLMIAFSRTATPSGPADWCSYSLDFGPVIPDYPKLGDTASLLLIGVNAFGGLDEAPGYIGSNLIWLTKPGKGTECPDASEFGIDNVDVQNGVTPVPANQIDRSETGWIVARDDQEPGDSLRLYKVSRNSSGVVTVDDEGESIDVPDYEIPDNAPQRDSLFRLDTLDGRMTQAVSAIDPRFDRVTLWTQHTVFGGLGSQVRWYELDPERKAVLQVGATTGTGMYTFNGAISPDRARRGNKARFGSNMVLSFNASSTDTYPALFVTSKIGGEPARAPVKLASSIGPANSFDCPDDDVCRWGDYAGASPDPKAPEEATTGKVWGSSMLAYPIQTYNLPISRTRNFVVKP